MLTYLAAEAWQTSVRSGCRFPFLSQFPSWQRKLDFYLRCHFLQWFICPLEVIWDGYLRRRHCYSCTCLQQPTVPRDPKWSAHERKGRWLYDKQRMRSARDLRRCHPDAEEHRGRQHETYSVTYKDFLSYTEDWYAACMWAEGEGGKSGARFHFTKFGINSLR